MLSPELQTRWTPLAGTRCAPTCPSRRGPDLKRLFGPGDLQQDLAHAVLADNPDGPLVVIGHSLGGQVAIEMALLAPQRVQRLILMCTRDIPVPEFVEAARELRAGGSVDVDAGIRRWLPYTALRVVEDWARMSPFVDPAGLAQRLLATETE